MAGLAQGIGSAVSPETFAAPSTGDVLAALGGDRDSTLANIGVGMATDPLTYAGALGGGMGGRAVGGALEGLAARSAGMTENAARVAEAEQSVEHLRQLTQAANEGLTAHTASAAAAAEAVPGMPGWLGDLQEGLRQGPSSQYRPDVLAALPADLSGASKLYKNVDPALAQQLEWMGGGTAEGDTGFRLAAAGKPDFTRVAGAKLMPGHARAAMYAGEEGLATPRVLGPRVTSYADTLVNPPGLMADNLSPAEKFAQMRQEAEGLGGARGLPGPPEPTLAQVLGEERARPLYQQTRGTAMMPGSKPGSHVHLLDTPVSQAPYHAFDRYSQGLRQLGLAQQDTQAPLTTLQALLARLGYG